MLQLAWPDRPRARAKGTQLPSQLLQLPRTHDITHDIKWPLRCQGRSNRPSQAGAGLVAGVDAGWYNTCALKADNSLWCWGVNNYGQLGDNLAESSSSVPVSVIGLGSGVVEVKAGWYHACARKTDGSLWCWGMGGSGQLGDGLQTGYYVPTAVPALSSGVAQVATGQSYSCARKTDGSLWCWGANGSGQLGDGTTNMRTTPTPVYGFGGCP